MLTLCSEICQAKGQSVDAKASASTMPEAAAKDRQLDPSGGSTAAGGATSSKARSDDGKRLKQVAENPSTPATDSTKFSASYTPATPEQDFCKNGSSPGVPGPFGVLRQPSQGSSLQSTLKNEVKSRHEELLRVQREDEQRTALVVKLEQEVFQKEHQLVELKTGMEKLGIKSDGVNANALEGAAVTPDRIADHERERLQREISLREGEAAELRKRLSGLEELIKDKRAEVVAKGEATLQLLFQLSSAATAQRFNAANPLMQASPTVVNDRQAPSASEEKTHLTASP